MFVLAELKDNIRISPDQFNIRLPDAIKDEINRKLANKVLLNVGLCISLKDITKLGDSVILPGDGASHTEVFYRYIVFKAAVGEILTGKIRSCNRDGVHVTLGFFDDIVIPPDALQHPSRFEEAEQAWVWEYPLDDGGHHDLFMDTGNVIKFKVTREIFEESSPVGPPVLEDASTTQASEPKIPYRVEGTINEPGLGVINWWDSQEATEDEVGEEGYEEGQE